MQSYSPCRDLSNGMSQTTYTQGNQVDSQLLVVESQTANLTPSFFFGHNLWVMRAHFRHLRFNSF